MGRFIVAVVYHDQPVFYADHMARFEQCTKPDGFEFQFWPIVHKRTEQYVRDLIVPGGGEPWVKPIYVKGEVGLQGFAHGDSLAHALVGEVNDDDLVCIMDHDAHPVDAGLFTEMIKEMRLRDKNGDKHVGVGVPQWHRGHTYLHPSCMLIDPLMIQCHREFCFKADYSNAIRSKYDSCEGFTLAAEDSGLPIKFFMVNETKQPWAEWDSENTKLKNSPLLIGEYGEKVHVGNRMFYGFEKDKPLVSHIWTVFKNKGRDYKIIDKYLIEVMN